MCHAALERLARKSLCVRAASSWRLRDVVRLCLIRLIDKSLTLLVHCRLRTGGRVVGWGRTATRSGVIHEVRMGKFRSWFRSRCDVVDARWWCAKLKLIANRIRIRFALLEVSMKIDARYLPSALFAFSRRMTVETADLAERVCAGLRSASDVARLNVPVDASRIQTRMLIGRIGLSWWKLLLILLSRRRRM